MKVLLAFTGKTTEAWLKEGTAFYLGRLKHYLPVESTELTPPKWPGGYGPQQVRQAEGQWLLGALPAHDCLVLLDETGKELSSTELATFLQSRMNQGTRKLLFLTGGPYGLSDEVRKAGQFILSLSQLTFTHQMTRLILAEQLYRAMTILRNEPYHNP